MSGYSGATAGWLGLSAILAGVVGLQISENVPLAPTVTAAPIETPAQGDGTFDLPALVPLSSDLVDEIVDRPLFSSSRRPFVPDLGEEIQAIEDGDQDIPLKLVGTMLAGTSEIALLKHPSEGLLRLRQGSRVDGWEVVKIDHASVELSRGDEIEVMKLRSGPDGEDDQAEPAPQPQKTSGGLVEGSEILAPLTAGGKQPAGD